MVEITIKRRLDAMNISQSDKKQQPVGAITKDYSNLAKAKTVVVIIATASVYVSQAADSKRGMCMARPTI